MNEKGFYLFIYFTLLCLGVRAYPKNPYFSLQKTFIHRTTKNKEILPSLNAQCQISVSPPENCKQKFATFDRPRSHKGAGPRAYTREKLVILLLVFQDHSRAQGKEHTQKKKLQIWSNKIKKKTTIEIKLREISESLQIKELYICRTIK